MVDRFHPLAKSVAAPVATAAVIIMALGSGCSTDARSAERTRAQPAAPQDQNAAPSPDETPASPETLTAARATAPSPDRVVPNVSRQLLVVTTTGWNEFQGVLRRFERHDSAQEWRRVGNDIDVVTGRYGLAWGRGLHPEMTSGHIKRERDQRSPAGVFDLGDAHGYAASAPEGTSWPYTRLAAGWRCVDEPRSEDYNKWLLPDGPAAIASPTPWDGVRRDVVFDTFIVVQHNSSPVVRGAGSCVLLHVWLHPGIPTQGCTGMAQSALHELLAWLSPEARPVLAQLPLEEAEALAPDWGLAR